MKSVLQFNRKNTIAVPQELPGPEERFSEDFLGKIESGLQILFWLKILTIVSDALGRNGAMSEAILKIFSMYECSLFFSLLGSSCHGLSSPMVRSKSAISFHMLFIASSGLY